MRLITLVLTLLLAHRLLAATPDLWLYYQTNLLPEENFKTLESIWRRAAAAGYDHVLLADFKFARLGQLGTNEQAYRTHVAQVRRLADQLHLQIVPAAFSVGYSNDILATDPNLAEGLPVKGALFVVHSDTAQLVPDPPVALKAKPDWFDSAYQLQDGIATTQGSSGNARLVWKVGVSPYRCYHVTVKIRTRDFTGEPEIKPLAGRRPLSFTKLGVKKTQDWTEHHIVFDSLANSTISIYLGVWGDAKGLLEWKDWKLEEVGPVNILRRPGAPCTVEGHTEGKDYDPIVDPRLGVIPWPGDYEVWHQPPTIRTHLPEGTKLRISWYFPAIIHDDQVGSCPSEPRTMQLMVNELNQLREVWGCRGIMMSHDEVRILNQDKSCLDRNLTPGQILAENVRVCTQLLDGNDAYVWSDMFDPYHNAVDDYYLVNGSLKGSWEGLDRRVTIVNWNFGKRQQSLRFFADRGHHQVIAGYYDGPVQQITQWLDAAEDIPNISGVMYTTWEHKYDDLERFAALVKNHSGH